DGFFFDTYSNMTAAADFGSRSLSFTTTNTITTVNLGFNPAVTNSLNLSGTLTYGAGSNQFSGTVTTAGGGVSDAPMSGTAQGFFYGPSATEIGGTFFVTGGGITVYGGGFGGRR